jgi:hypothetical protein
LDDTPNLILPYIMAAQAQKHVTHNEAIRALDAVVQLSVLDRDLTAPPGGPAEGDRYIVAAGATGAWASQDDRVAAYQDGAWMVYAPREGWIAWVADEDKLYAWDGAAWVVAGTDSLNPAPLVGVNATADATNRLSVSAPATLLSHEGAGHQLKVNKSADTDTASLLYQTGFSGRAEMGLAGDDDFHVKVSPDGSTWHEAVVVDKDTGNVGVGASLLFGSGTAVSWNAGDVTLTHSSGVLALSGIARINAKSGVNDLMAFYNQSGTNISLIEEASGLSAGGIRFVGWRNGASGSGFHLRGIVNNDNGSENAAVTLDGGKGANASVIPTALAATPIAIFTNATVTKFSVDYDGALSAVGAELILSGTAIPAGGTAGAGYKLSSTPDFGVFFGSGAPTLAAAKGSLYLRSDGSGAGDRAYINTDGSTTWTALTTAA